MKRLGLTEKALAGMINVDKTLINKWKNGKRALDAASAHFENVVSALEKFSKSMTPNVLAKFFKDYLPEKNLREKIAEYLAAGGDEDSPLSAFGNGKNIPIMLFSGCDERPSAFKCYFDDAESVRNDEIFLLQTQDFECSSQNEEYASDFMQYLKSALGNSNVVNLLYLCYDAKSFRESFIELCPLALKDNFNLHVKFLPAAQGRFKLSSFSAGNKVCIVAQTIPQKPAQMLFVIMKDAALCEFETRRWKLEAADSVPFCKKYALSAAGKIFSEIAAIPESPAPTVIYSSCPTFFAMSEQLLRQIMNANKLPKTKIDSAITFYNSVKNIYIKNLGYGSVKELYNLSAVADMLKSPLYYSPYLSVIAQRNISIPQSLYKAYFAEMLNFFTENTNTEITLLSQPFKGTDDNFVYIIKQYNYALAATSAYAKNNLLFTRAIQPVELLYSAFEEQYSAIPDFVKSKETLAAHLKRAISSLS
jgi:transcriptional regulator with XRE-family HTH domain